MSTPEVQTESKGSVKISRNAKGEQQYEVKVYAGEPELVISAARQVAVSQYRKLEEELAS